MLDGIKLNNYNNMLSLIEQAKKDNKVFYRNDLHGELWFAPDDLRQKMENGWYCWPVDSWTLRHPAEVIRDAVLKCDELMKEAMEKFDRMTENS